MRPSKSLGPDEYHASFYYKKTTEVIGSYTFNFFKKIWANPDAHVEINQTDTCLIHKVSHLEFIN